MKKKQGLFLFVLKCSIIY